MAKARERRQNEVTYGSTNVFADIGYPDAEERQTRLRLAYTINQIIDQRRLTQTAAAEILGISQPKISALRHYKMEGFSIERLMTLLTALDRDVEIHIRKKSPRRTPGRITVVA